MTQHRPPRGRRNNMNYKFHVFCCTNQRPAGSTRGCCADKGAEKLRNYMKARAKELGIEQTRINASGCLDECESGPVMVVYPDGVWYRYSSEADIDRILKNYLAKDEMVEDLLVVCSEKD